jgi:hypothetical protein
VSTVFSPRFGGDDEVSLLVYQDEKMLDALSQDELDALVDACMSWLEELEKSGHHIFSAGLQSVRTAATVRHKHGEPTLTDGPFADTKEFLRGFTTSPFRRLNFTQPALEKPALAAVSGQL